VACRKFIIISNFPLPQLHINTFPYEVAAAAWEKLGKTMEKNSPLDKKTLKTFNK